VDPKEKDDWNDNINNKAAKQKELDDLLVKIQGGRAEEINNLDILRFLTIVNFNFAALSSLHQATLIKLDLMEEVIIRLNQTIEEMAKKLSQFVKDNKLFNQAFDNSESNDELDNP